MRVATQYATVRLLPVGAQAPRAPPSRRNVAVLSHAEYVPTLTAAAALRVKAALSKAAWWVVTLTFDLESGVRVTCDVGYLYANFSLPRPLCSRVRPDVRDRQTDVRQKHSLMPPPVRGGGIKSAQRRRKHCALAVVRRTHKQTHKQTGAITIHCAA